MGDAIGVSAVAAGLSTVIKIFEISYALRAVNEQTADLLSTTLHVSRNIREARRLRRQKEGLLNGAERTWMDGVIDDNEEAVRAVAVLIEPSRIDVTTGAGIGAMNRTAWVFRGGPKVRDKHARLTVCHQSLGMVINALYSRDVVVVSPVGVDAKDYRPPPPYDWPHRRRVKKELLTLKKDGDTSTKAAGEAAVASASTIKAMEDNTPNLESRTHDCSIEEFGVQTPEPVEGGWTKHEVVKRSEGLGQNTHRVSDTGRRGSRRQRGSWLAFHATRSNLGHSTDTLI